MTNLLIALVVILTIAALVQLVRVNELLSEITNEDTNAVTDDDNNKNGIFFLLTIPLFFGVCSLADGNMGSPFITSRKFFARS